VVEVTKAGWSIVKKCPVRFLRPRGLLPLAAPVPGGSIAELRQFLNIRDQDFVLVVAYLLAALYPMGSFPVLVVTGGHGSAKSTLAKFVRELVDPNTSPLRQIPRKPQDFHIMARNGYVLAFDNLARISEASSDILCQLSTGAGFSTRKLRTDDGEMIFHASRPIILNGIETIVGRPDLADRSIFISLEHIPNPRPGEELRAEFSSALPRILGALLDGLSLGLKRLPDVQLGKYPRMADFAKFATACEQAFWEAGTFATAYAANQERAVDELVESDPLACALKSFMSKEPKWHGTATELFKQLSASFGSYTGDGDWPRSPMALSGRLTRLMPTFRRCGWLIKREREGHAGTRLIFIERL